MRSEEGKAYVTFYLKAVILLLVLVCAFFYKRDILKTDLVKGMYINPVSTSFSSNILIR